MRKNLTVIFSIILLSSMILTSCKKNIDLLPTDSISNDDAIKTYDDLSRATIGVYAALNYHQAFYTNTIMADEARWGTDNASRNTGRAYCWDFDSSDTHVTGAWASMYKVIDRVNKALEAYNEVTTALPAEAINKPRLRGELLAIRAMAHAEMLRWFAPKYTNNDLGVVIMLKPVTIFNKPLRSTFGEVMKQIKADFQEAEDLIARADALNTKPAADALFRFSVPAIAAFRARAALYAQEWNDAATYAARAIAAKGTLATGVNYINIWNDSNNSENYFLLCKNANAGSIRTYWTDDNSDVFFSPSFKLIDTYNTVNDIRYNAFIQRDNSVAANRETWKVNKYPGQSAASRFNNVKVIRTSEMYLILAEANAELNRIDEGAAALNAVRRARITGYVNQTFNKETLIDAVMQERYKELAFEGHRFFDLRRRQLPVERDDRDIAIGAAVPKTLAITARNYILPIPLHEITANPGIQRNPGY